MRNCVDASMRHPTCVVASDIKAALKYKIFYHVYVAYEYLILTEPLTPLSVPAYRA